MRKFIRKYRLTVGPTFQNDLGSAQIHLLPGNEEDITIQYPITLEFTISRNPFQKTNTSTFRLFNLSQDTRNALYKDQFSFYLLRKVTLEAGYEEPLPVVFQGNIMSCSSWRPEGGVDYVTEIRAWDYAYAIANSITNRTVTGPVTKNQVVDGLMGDLVNYGVTRGIRSEFEGEHSRGRVICGPTWEALQTETGGFGYIDGGKVYALKDNDCFEGVIPEISSETGLLATPRRYDRGVTVEMLFEPRLEVGQRVTLKSRAIIYQAFQTETIAKVMGISHAGIISDAVAGKCKTTAQLFLGLRELNVLTGQVAA